MIESHRSAEPKPKTIFTASLQVSLTLARKEADRLSPERLVFVGTEHWLLGLRELPQCGAQRVLQALGVFIEPAAKRLEARAKQSVVEYAGKTSPYTEPFKKALAQVLEGDEHGGFRGTHHLLMEVLESDLVLAEELTRIGLHIKSLRDVVKSLGVALRE